MDIGLRLAAVCGVNSDCNSNHDVFVQLLIRRILKWSLVCQGVRWSLNLHRWKLNVWLRLKHFEVANNYKYDPIIVQIKMLELQLQPRFRVWI